MMSPSKLTPKRRIWLLVCLVLAPLIVAAGVLWAVGTRDSRLNQIQAAVVNNDVAVTIDGKPMPLGRQLAAELISSPGANITWVLTDADSAAKGLASGSYAAVVTVPKTFSAAATSFGGPAENVRQAVISIDTSKTAGVADTVIGKTVADTAARALSTNLTQTYLDRIYLGFNEMGAQFVTVSDGAKELATGAGKLSNGIAQARDGGRELTNGLGKLDANTPTLKQGANSLLGGARELSDGLATMRNQTTSLPGQVGELNLGVKQLTDGAHRSAAGTAALSNGISTLSAGTSQLAGGLNQMSGKMGQLTDGAQQLRVGAQPLTAGVTAYTNGVTASAQGAGKLAAGLGQLNDKVQQIPDLPIGSLGWVEDVRPLLDDVVPTLERVTTGIEHANSQLDVIGQTGVIPGLPMPDIPCPPDLDEASCQIFKAGAQAALTEGVKAGAKVAKKAMNDPELTGGTSITEAAHKIQQAMPQIKQGIGQAEHLLAMLATLPKQFDELKAAVTALNTGAQQLSGGLNQLSAHGGELRDGADKLATGAGSLADGIDQLAQGVHVSATGASSLADGAQAAAGGAQQLSNGNQQLADGLSRLSTGTQALTNGMTQLTDGIARAADGSQRYVVGLGDFVNGLGSYTDGVSQAAAGASKLNDGMTDLANGGDTLATGTTKLANGLADGATKVPSYSELARENLKTAVTNPIQVNAASTSARIPATALLVMLALWFAALGTYLLLRPVPADTLTSARPTWRLMARACRLGSVITVAAGLALTMTASLVMHISLLRAAGLLVFLLLAGFAFFAVNHALAAWWPNIGRLVSLVLAVIGFVWALTSAAPSIFGVLAPLSPVTAGISGARAIAAGGTSFVGPVAGLLGWLVLGLLGTAAAVARGRQVRVKQLLVGTA